MPSGADLCELANDALKDFALVAELASKFVEVEKIQIETLSAPHNPPSSLPRGTMAIYAFFYEARCLKVGKAGPKSQPRYLSQHYNPLSSNSNLAKSLVKSRHWADEYDLSVESINAWIKTNTSRLNIILPEGFGNDVLSLLEVFLHCRWAPEFEGKI